MASVSSDSLDVVARESAGPRARFADWFLLTGRRHWVGASLLLVVAAAAGAVPPHRVIRHHPTQNRYGSANCRY